MHWYGHIAQSLYLVIESSLHIIMFIFVKGSSFDYSKTITKIPMAIISSVQISIQASKFTFKVHMDGIQSTIAWLQELHRTFSFKSYFMRNSKFQQKDSSTSCIRLWTCCFYVEPSNQYVQLIGICGILATVGYVHQDLALCTMISTRKTTGNLHKRNVHIQINRSSKVETSS